MEWLQNPLVWLSTMIGLLAIIPLLYRIWSRRCPRCKTLKAVVKTNETRKRKKGRGSRIKWRCQQCGYSIWRKQSSS